MSERIDTPQEFKLGDIVEFDHERSRLRGEVVRVYNTRYNYHVEVDGERYSVNLNDNMSRPGERWREMARDGE